MGYGRQPETIIVKRTGFADVTLTKISTGTGAASLWLGDISVAASDYSVVLTRNTNGLINQVITPVVVAGAVATPAQFLEQVHPGGNASPATMGTALTRPDNGLSLKFALGTLVD